MKAKILLIEDVEDLRVNLSEILELNGFIVLQAKDGTEGLEMMNNSEIDIIVSDIMMPNMDGFQLLEKVRANANWINIPFIFLTAKISQKDLRDGMEKGAEDFLTKPVKSKDLIKAINTALSKKKQREQILEGAIQKAIIDERNIKYHELRTPLFGLMTILEFLLKSFDQLDPQSIKNLLGKAEYSAKRLNESLLKLNRFQELDQLEIEKKEIPSLLKFFQNHLKLDHEKLIEYLNINNDFKVCFTPEHLNFICNELINNALKFGDPTQKVKVKFDTDNSVEISNKQQILSGNIEVNPYPFFQVNRDFHEQQGLGLGLYLVKKICDKNDCKIILYTDEKAVFFARLEFSN